MSDDRRITIGERFGTVKFRERGAVSISPRFTGPVRFTQQALEISERVLTQPIRFVGQEYPPFVLPLTISGLSFFQIGRLSATVQYTVNRDCACTIYTRKEEPLGSWEGKVYPGYHGTHLHATLTLVSGVWYHLYVYAIDAGGAEDTEPTYPPNYYRFKTATETEPGINDGVH